MLFEANFTSKCALHGHISRLRNPPYTGGFRRTRNLAYSAKFRDEICPTRANFVNSDLNSVNSKFDFTEFTSWGEMCPTRAHFEVFLARVARKFALANLRLARKHPKCVLHGYISASKWSEASFWRSSQKVSFKFWFQNFWNIDEIEAELVQQWYSISPTLLNFRIFRKFDLNRKIQKSKLNAVRGNCPLRF